MSLRAIRNPKPEEMSGIGFKIVRKTSKEDEFLPEWEYFFLDGEGGTNLTSQKTFKCETIYKLGETYTINHNRIANILRDDEKLPIIKYLAGVHLYINFCYDLYINMILLNLQQMKKFTIIRCLYKDAITISDIDAIVVAKSITPVEVVRW